MPALLGLHDAEALLPRPVEIVGGIACAAQADLDAARAVQQPFLDGTAEWRAVSDLLAEHDVVDVGVGVYLHETHRAVLALQRPQDREDDRVVAAHCQRLAVVVEDLVVRRFDEGNRLLQIEGIDGHIADVGDRQAVERRRARRHVVGPNQAAFGTDLARAEAGAGAVGRAGVHRHADEADIEVLGAGETRQTKHRRQSAEARHLVAAERLVQGLAHGLVSFPSRVCVRAVSAP